MTTFIKLHTADKEPIYINPAYIVSVIPVKRATFNTVINTAAGVDTVIETADEVLDRIYREERE